MKIASVADMKARLSAYLKASATGPVVVTRNGKAVAVLLGVRDDEELERLLLAHSRKLRAIRMRVKLSGCRKNQPTWARSPMSCLASSTTFKGFPCAR